MQGPQELKTVISMYEDILKKIEDTYADSRFQKYLDKDSVVSELEDSLDNPFKNLNEGLLKKLLIHTRRIQEYSGEIHNVSSLYESFSEVLLDEASRNQRLHMLKLYEIVEKLRLFSFKEFIFALDTMYDGDIEELEQKGLGIIKSLKALDDYWDNVARDAIYDWALANETEMDDKDRIHIEIMMDVIQEFETVANVEINNERAMDNVISYKEKLLSNVEEHAVQVDWAQESDYILKEDKDRLLKLLRNHFVKKEEVSVVQGANKDIWAGRNIAQIGSRTVFYAEDERVQKIVDIITAKNVAEKLKKRDNEQLKKTLLEDNRNPRD